MKKSYEVLNIKCEGCATSVKNALKSEFGEIEVDLEKMPRVVTVKIENESKERELRLKLRDLGYPFANEEVGVFEGGGLKAKSFVSCAIGKFDNFTANRG